MSAIRPIRHVRAGAWLHIGGVADGVVRRIGLRAIRVHLGRAAVSDGFEAAASIREANGIRQQLKLSWDQVAAAGAGV